MQIPNWLIFTFLHPDFELVKRQHQERTWHLVLQTKTKRLIPYKIGQRKEATNAKTAKEEIFWQEIAIMAQ